MCAAEDQEINLGAVLQLQVCHRNHDTWLEISSSIPIPCQVLDSIQQKPVLHRVALGFRLRA